jgi:hypothetical protein
MGDLGKYNIEMFPEELIALREEIQKHPDLLVILHGQPDKDVYIQINEIAAWAGVVLDGTYTQDDIVKLCGVLVEQLQKRRTIHVQSIIH